MDSDRHVISDDEDNCNLMIDTKMSLCKKCSMDTIHKYRGGIPRLLRGWKCIPCQERTHQEMLNAYKHKMSLKCIKCNGGGQGDNSGMFYTIDNVQKYVCDNCIRCEECGRGIDREESRIYYGKHWEQSFHMICYERAYNCYVYPGYTEKSDPTKKTALYPQMPVSGYNRY